MKVGIVGLPNAGKSTLFNAIMKEALAAAANYPFCTIDPNIGKVPVIDERLEVLEKIVQAKKIIETRLACVDIAGLIKGASKGEGLGNSFLDNIRDVDLILHVIRAFKDSDTGAQPTVMHDIEVIETELMLADMQRLERFLEKNKKDPKNEHLPTAKRAIELLDAGKRLIDGGFDTEELKWFREIGMLTIKPYLYIANVNEDEMDKKASEIAALKDLVEKAEVIVCCATYEYELSQVPELKEGICAMDVIIKKAYDTLNLLTFFTAGEQEVRAWTIKKDACAPEAAGVIHTDFEQKFIRAEVASYDEFVEHGGWDGVKHAGKLRTEGKKYVVQDGDVCFFKI